jgi:hypothetical protein
MCWTIICCFQIQNEEAPFPTHHESCWRTRSLLCAKKDAAGKKGRMLTYGVSADATYEYIRIGESTALESLRKFVTAIV